MEKTRCFCFSSAISIECVCEVVEREKGVKKRKRGRIQAGSKEPKRSTKNEE